MALPGENFVRERLLPLVSTQARRRMLVVAATALFFSIFSVGADVILPLWVTKDLGLDAYQWAQLRSLRMAGVLVGVIVLGALSDRFGQRLLGALSMLGVAGILLALRMGPRTGIWVAMPVFGALVSTAFVNLNTLTQQISYRRQGVANTIYRSVGAAASIGAPVLVTGLALAWHGYRHVFLGLAVMLVVAAVILFYYPAEELPRPAGSLREEIRRLWQGYRAALRERELMRFIHVSQIWGNLLAGVGAFAAIRFTAELGQTDQQFGTLSAVAGAATFLATAGAGFFLDRVSLRKIHGVSAVITALCSLLMGVSDLVWLSVVGFIAFGPVANMLVAPTSMWVSRTAGRSSQTAAFSVHKVLSALYVAVTMFLLSLLEHLVGIRALLLYGGLLGLFAGLAFFLLPEPPHPRK